MADFRHQRWCEPFKSISPEVGRHGCGGKRLANRGGVISRLRDKVAGTGGRVKEEGGSGAEDGKKRFGKSDDINEW